MYNTVKRRLTFNRRKTYILVKRRATRYDGGVKMQVGFRLEEDLIAAVDRLADEERRNRSNMVEVLLHEALAARQAGAKAPATTEPRKP